MACTGSSFCHVPREQNGFAESFMGRGHGLNARLSDIVWMTDALMGSQATS